MPCSERAVEASCSNGVDPMLSVAARDLRDTWQSKVLRETQGKPLGMVILSMIAHSWPTEHVLVLLKVTFPGFASIAAPFLISAGKIATTGHIIADMVGPDGETQHKAVVLFSSEAHMRDVLRRFADRIGLNDDDRQQLFICARKWVVCDYRLDPNMNPNDPDAKRIVN